MLRVEEQPTGVLKFLNNDFLFTLYMDIDCKNYLPSVSVLPILSKVIQNAMQNRLINYLAKHKVLHKNQYNFRKNCNTDTAMVTKYKR